MHYRSTDGLSCVLGCGDLSRQATFTPPAAGISLFVVIATDDLTAKRTSVKMNSDVLWQLCVLVLLGVSRVHADEVSVSVMEGDSVTLPTNVTANEHEIIRWYFNDNQVVEINKGNFKICRDDECKKRFGNRLKLDHQTGSLTITNTRTTDTGKYHLDIIDPGSDSEKTFNLTVNGVSAPSNPQMKINPAEGGESDIIQVCLQLL